MNRLPAPHPTTNKIMLSHCFFSPSSDDVQFCGYTVPHPAESKMLFRIQSHGTPALEILKRGLKDLEKVCDHTINLFQKNVNEFNKTWNLFLFLFGYEGTGDSNLKLQHSYCNCYKVEFKSYVLCLMSCSRSMTMPESREAA